MSAAGTAQPVQKRCGVRDGLIFRGSAVAIDDRAILIEGPPGSGKSTTVMRLIDRGATLIGDDAVSLRFAHDCLTASPPPNIAGLLEVRGVGIVRLAATKAPVALVLECSDTVERMPEPRWRDILGVMIPALKFDPQAPAAALRAKYALHLHGIDTAIASMKERAE